MREFSDIIRLSRKYLVTREFIGIPKISRGSNFASFRSPIRTNSKCWQTIVRSFNIGWYRFPVMLLFLEETRNIETFFQERISQVSPKRIMRYVNINIGEAPKNLNHGCLVFSYLLIFREQQVYYVTIVDVNNRAIRSFLGVPINLPINFSSRNPV